MSGMSSENRVRLMYKYAAQLEGEMRSGEIAPERLGRSLATQWAVVKAIELIGEQAWELRKAGVDLGGEVPLAEIAGMRHRLVHHYEGVENQPVDCAHLVFPEQMAAGDLKTPEEEPLLSLSVLVA